MLVSSGVNKEVLNDIGSKIQELYSANFTDNYFYELLSYATNFMAKSKMIEVYIK